MLQTIISNLSVIGSIVSGLLAVAAIILHKLNKDSVAVQLEELEKTIEDLMKKQA